MQLEKQNSLTECFCKLSNGKTKAFLVKMWNAEPACLTETALTFQSFLAPAHGAGTKVPIDPIS